MEPARTPADKLVSPSIVLFRAGQVSLRPSRRRFRTRGAPWAPLRGQGSPGSLRPAPPARASPLPLASSRSSLDFGRSFAERGMGGQAQVLPRESSPLFLSPARGALVSLRRQFSAPSLRSTQTSLALEANWYRNRSLSFSFLSLSFRISHTQILVFILGKSDFYGTSLNPKFRI